MSVQARRCTFYRNGDQFFTGLLFPVKPQLRRMDPHRAFEHLLTEVYDLSVDEIARHAATLKHLHTPTSQTDRRTSVDMPSMISCVTMLAIFLHVKVIQDLKLRITSGSKTNFVAGGCRGNSTE